MPQMTTVSLPSSTWTQITNANATSITFQNLGDGVIVIKGTVGAVAPSDATGGIQYLPGQGEINVTLADLFPGVSGANRIYAYAQRSTGSVSVNHA